MSWDAERKLLFSGSFDQAIIVWDIGSQTGTAYELQGHHNKVTSLCYASPFKTLISGSEDCMMVFWNMEIKRQEVKNLIFIGLPRVRGNENGAERSRNECCGNPILLLILNKGSKGNTIYITLLDARMGRKRLLPEVHETIFLEYQSDG